MQKKLQPLACIMISRESSNSSTNGRDQNCEIQVDLLCIKACHRVFRVCTRMIPHLLQAPDMCAILFFNFPLNCSTMGLSAELLKSRDEVDAQFCDRLSRLQYLQDIQTRTVFFDSSGTNVSAGDVKEIDLLDLMDSIAYAKLYETLELGCCRTYSHHKFKTRCLACVGFVFGTSDIVTQIINRLRTDFENQSG